MIFFNYKERRSQQKYEAYEELVRSPKNHLYYYFREKFKDPEAFKTNRKILSHPQKSIDDSSEKTSSFHQGISIQPSGSTNIQGSPQKFSMGCSFESNSPVDFGQVPSYNNNNLKNPYRRKYERKASSSSAGPCQIPPPILSTTIEDSREQSLAGSYSNVTAIFVSAINSPQDEEKETILDAESKINADDNYLRSHLTTCHSNSEASTFGSTHSFGDASFIDEEYANII